MTKIKAILVVSFILTFAAGTAAGLLIAYVSHPRPGHSRLESVLNLNAEQKEQMDGIWSEVRDAMVKQRNVLRQDRDKAIIALLTDDQRSRYDAILKKYSRKVAEMPNPFEEAIKRTKEILTPEQAAKYDEWMEKQRERGFGPPHGGRRGPPPDGPPGPPSGPPPDSPHPPHGGG